MNIPQIVHKIAPKEKAKWDRTWIHCHESWKSVYSDSEFMMWDDSDLYNLIDEHYPIFSKKYRELKYDVMRYDIGRYLLMYHYGGIYADMDLFCHKKIDQEVHNSNALVEDVKVKCLTNLVTKEIIFYRPFNITSNFLLVAKKPKDIFWKNLIDFCFKNCETVAFKDHLHCVSYINYTTGPLAISDFSNKHQNEFTLLKSELFTYNINQKYKAGSKICYESSEDQESIIDDFYRINIMHDRYTTHYETITWYEKILNDYVDNDDHS